MVGYTVLMLKREKHDYSLNAIIIYETKAVYWMQENSVTLNLYPYL
jgi:hypothetical protein